MNVQLIVLGLVTGALTGAFFALVDVPIPAPPELPGLMGIVGIYLGYKLVEYSGASLDVLDSLGL
jgi:XapX domain-containing protein